jgi:hypothetical protein
VSSDRSSGVKIKGSGFAPTLEHIQTVYGEARLEQVLARLPGDGRQTLLNALASGWYPVELVGEFMAAIHAELSSEDPQIIRHISRESAKATFGRIYRLFIKMGTPGFIIRRVASVWRTIVSTGTLAVVDQGDHHLVVRLTEFPYRNPDYCGERLTGWFCAPLELSGCEIIEAEHTACTSRGDPHCEWRFRWA